MDTTTLIWLFPIAFMFHDFEEIILGEAWLKKNAGDLRRRLEPRLPAFLSQQIGVVLEKSTPELALSVALIFALTAIVSYLAAVNAQYGPFVVASGLFFLHGFVHLGQALLLRRYVPAALTSALVVIPYGLILFRRLLAGGLIDPATMLACFALAAVMIAPFILFMHKAGEILYGWLLRRLV